MVNCKQNNSKWWQWLLIGIVGLLVLLGVPSLLNLAIISEQQFEIVGEGKDWLLFWSAWLGAIASFAMVIATYITLRQNKKIIEGQNRARLNFSVIPSQQWYSIKITNLGKEAAYGIEVKFNRKFIDCLENGRKKIYNKLMQNKFALEAGASKYLPIGQIEGALEYWKSNCEVVEITGRYCNNYKIEEHLDISEYMHIGLIHNDVFTTEFQYFKKGVIVQNNSYMPIQKSLDMIAKK